MKISNNKIVDIALKCAILVCVCMAALRAGEFIAGRVPPYKEGQCLQPLRDDMDHLIAKVEKNHVFTATSDLGVFYYGYRIAVIKVTFDDERASESKFLKVNCN